MESDLNAVIRTKYNTLSDAQKQVADYILEYPEKVMYSSLGNLAAEINVSETTVLRFLRKINYTSYQVFKVHLAQSLSTDTKERLYNEVSINDSLKNITDKIINSTSEAIADCAQTLNISQLEGFVNTIERANKIFVVGAGSSSAIAFDLFHKLIKLGLDATMSSDAHIINIICAGLKPNDVLICVSHSGESREILCAVENAKNTGCGICSVTSFENSSLVVESDYILLSSSRETHFRSDALLSRIIQMTFVDMIYVSLAVRLKDTAMDNIERSREAVAMIKK